MTNRHPTKNALVLLLVAFGLAACTCASAQDANPTQTEPPDTAQTPIQLNNGEPLYKIEVVARDIPAVNYFHRSKETRIGFRGTELLPDAHGWAEVRAEGGRTKIELH